MNNYSKKRELENQRLDMFDEAIELYNAKDFDNALIVFEEVAALEPKNYMGDDFSKTTEIYKVAQYNIACCYAAMRDSGRAVDVLLQQRDADAAVARGRAREPPITRQQLLEMESIHQIVRERDEARRAAEEHLSCLRAVLQQR